MAIASTTSAPSNANVATIEYPFLNSSLTELPPTENLKSLARYYSVLYGIDYDQFSAVLNCESGWNPNASNPSGALGVAQFMKTTYLQWCGDTDERLNPEKEIQCAARMFSEGQAHQWVCYAIVNP